MGGRDHSIECDVCGYQRGGLNDLHCNCDEPRNVTCDDELMWVPRPVVRTVGRVYTWQWMLAHNLAIAGALCAAYILGYRSELDWIETATSWKPGCNRTAPEWK